MTKELNVSPYYLRKYMKDLNIGTKSALRRREAKELSKSNQKRCYTCSNIFPKTEDFFHFYTEPKENKRICFHSCRRCWKEKGAKAYSKTYNSIESFANFMCRSKKRPSVGKMCTLEEKDIINQYNKQKGLCFYTGEILFFGENSHFTISIDRVDSSIGYTKENIVLCCKIVNLMKSDCSKEDFKLWCSKVVTHNN